MGVGSADQKQMMARRMRNRKSVCVDIGEKRNALARLARGKSRGREPRGVQL